MQDRSPPARRNHLQRAAGPYIRVTGAAGVVLSQGRLAPQQRTCGAGGGKSAWCQKAEVATTRILSSNCSSGRSYLCNGDAGDREQPTDNQLWGHTVVKEQYARNQGEHWKQQAEWCDAAHGATGDQPEPKAKPNNSSDENCVGECQPTTFIRRDKARQLSVF